MGNSLYNYSKELLLSGSLDLLTDDIKAILVDNTYVPNTSTDQYVDPVLGFAITTGISLLNKSISAGTFSADPITFSAVMGNIYFIIIYRDTGDPTTSPLICLFDSVPGFPVNATGDDYTINWNSGSNQLFSV